MRDLLKKLQPVLRECGFRQAGPNFRKSNGDLLCVINLQSSRDGMKFYVNLGAQPVFIPTEGPPRNADSRSIKEYKCVVRTRVGSDWRWEMSDSEAVTFASDLVAEQARFFAHVGTFRQAIETATLEVLLSEFSWSSTQARAALHIARASDALGLREKAHAAAQLGLELAGAGASGLRLELRSLLARIADAAPAQ